MAFPEFDGGAKRILFFTRGRGRGHAIPDMEIARELGRESGVEVRLVSYGTGASTFAAHGVAHIGLGLPDRNSLNETIVMAGKLIGWLDPDVVVAHEEFPALPAARIFDKPAVLITDWFTDPSKYSMETLRYADRILFLDEPGIYEEPEWVQGRVDYLGPLVRKFGYTRDERGCAREELGIPHGAFVVAMLPGSWREEQAPAADLVLGAFDTLPEDGRRLVWMAGEDRDLIAGRTAGRADVEVRGYEPEIGRIMVAADVAVTKGTRKTLFELSSLGVPSVSLDCTGNPIDRVRARQFPGNEAMGADVDAPALGAAIGRAALRTPPRQYAGDGGKRCARRLLEVMESLGVSEEPRAGCSDQDKSSGD
ncbi:MAG: hypothetical protein IT168_05040 [Bryobacterales bacterium]|nr:hypothetical protein [Bryobacterales bacterium]